MRASNNLVARAQIFETRRGGNGYLQPLLVFASKGYWTVREALAETAAEAAEFFPAPDLAEMLTVYIPRQAFGGSG
jgi:hypothetical protein